MRRSRFQQGSLRLVERAGSRKAWEYRWYEAQPDGTRRRRNLVLGTLEQYPNETAPRSVFRYLSITTGKRNSAKARTKPMRLAERMKATSANGFCPAGANTV
jgi:hypothetical protein